MGTPSINPIPQTAKDIAIAHLAADVVALTDRVQSLEDDVDTYRALAQEAITALHDATADRARLREQLSRLRDEFRAVREHLMRPAA